VSRAAGAAFALALVVDVGSARAYAPNVEYALNCQGCHRADGAGTPGSVPPLAGSVARFLGAAGGREYLVQVPGVAQAPLDDGRWPQSSTGCSSASTKRTSRAISPRTPPPRSPACGPSPSPTSRAFARSSCGRSTRRLASSACYPGKT